MILKQEIDGPQARHATDHLFANGHLFTLEQEKDGPQVRHLELAFCLHFMKQGIGELQVIYLQPASCLLSEMEVMTKIR